MSTKHTPEPWWVDRVCITRIAGYQDRTIATTDAFRSNMEDEYTVNETNAARIVACVNACAGMGNPSAEITALRERIAELEAKVPTKPQPNWDEAPEWANWWAVDSDGEPYWYESKPRLGLLGWAIGDGGTCTNQEYIDLQGFDWRETLTQRP